MVRSSATKEDSETSSMAGLFVSRLDVRGWDAFVDAVGDVLASKDGVSGDDGAAADVEMAVLVQPFLVPTWGGVHVRRRSDLRAHRPHRRLRRARAGPIGSSAARSTAGRRR